MEKLTQPDFPYMIDMPTETLNQRVELLTDNLKTINYTPERKAWVQREISHIALELWCRRRDEHGKV